MWREKTRERSSSHYGNRQSMRGEDRGHGERRFTRGRRDFREKLVSVFIDNLNSKVDVAYLWGVFKVFGRVRDVFLSSNNSLRKRSYAFVRFESMEEAINVANSVDGMHVYGWPISAKIADFNWNNKDQLRLKRVATGLRLRTWVVWISRQGKCRLGSYKKIYESTNLCGGSKRASERF
ncbi:hypothetical protein Dsin_021029 [Dipteronia sinensis]|uniref:RRM domain-containing protein n=1 Tax=Dipteronia sinensis TaxID=43782 RepID=A0AAE0E4C4_9ROSI|nr:hypothetical protein Dsin_021029 [Dipteronia sinensis]